MLKKIFAILFLSIVLITPVKANEIPDDAVLDYNQGIDYYKLGLHEKAIECFRSAVRTYPDYIDIRKVVDMNDLEKDIYNVPTSKVKTNDEVEVAIVPAVAMNKDKYRLGYGKGYYDKYLKNKNILKIAVVNSEFLVDDKYQDEWDVCFDIIVTEKEIIR